MITLLIKCIIGLSVSLYLGFPTANKPTDSYALLSQSRAVPEDSIMINAYQVLTTKCNVCHIKRNRRRVFTPDNMNPWAAIIYEQVFIEKRMPRGNKIKLTNEEYQNLLTWFTSTKNEL